MGVGETVLVLLAGLIPLGYAAFYVGRRKALDTVADGVRMHSRPQQLQYNGAPSLGPSETWISSGLSCRRSTPVTSKPSHSPSASSSG